MVAKVEKRRAKYPIDDLEEYHKELEEVNLISQTKFVLCRLIKYAF